MIRRLVLTALASVFLAGAARAAETNVAVAANFTEPAKEIAAAFEKKTGHKTVLSFGSSGQFVAQIAGGAPFDVLLSADVEGPRKLEADGLTQPGSRFTYATGRLVLYSKTPGLVDGRGGVLARGRFEKIAIADPRAAPYGVAAIETMRKLGLHDKLAPKIVRGSSITQAYQFVETGAAELGLIALSQVVATKGGSRWLVPEANHTAIDQQAVLVKRGAANPAAKAFLAFLRTAESRAIIRRYGYKTP